MDSKRETVSYIKNASVAIISLVLLIYPALFLANTTDAFIFPKQVLLTLASIVLLVLWGIRIIIERKITIKSNPFNIPAFVFGIILVVSAFLSVDRFDSLFQAIPAFMAVLFFFVTVNTVDDRRSFNFTLSALSLGAVIAAFIGILYSFQIYILPIEAVKNPSFNTFGSPVQLIAYILPMLLLSSFYVYSGVKQGAFKNISNIKSSYGLLVQAIASVALVGGIAAVVYRLIISPKPIFLPFSDGFQIALASISRDAGRQVVAAFFGSGYGTFLVDFTRFKLATFNTNETLWNIPFSFSSSYFLELVATAGILGALAFLFLLVKVVRTRIMPINPLYSALLLVFGLSFLIPFSFSMVFLLFVLLAFYTAFLAIERDRRVDTVSISLVALKEGLFSVTDADANTRRRSNSGLLPALLFLVIIIVGGFIGFYTIRMLTSDITFAQSLQREALTSGQKTYDLQRKALQEFPYRSDYYRVFSRVNLALANSLASSVPQGSSPSAQVQQQMTQLLQQSINAGRQAVTLSPANTVNWQNLAQIYRSLINVGQNAGDFAVASLNQAIALDPSNPLLYVEMGGIFYQVGQYDLAQNQFQLAVQLKPDYANARYNLGHALEAKKNYQAALVQYQIVKQLVTKDPTMTKKINEEIAAIEPKAGEQAQAAQQQAQQQNLQAQENPEDLQLASPAAQLPAQQQQIQLPQPPQGQRLSPTPAPTGTRTPTPSVGQ